MRSKSSTLIVSLTMLKVILSDELIVGNSFHGMFAVQLHTVSEFLYSSKNLPPTGILHMSLNTIKKTRLKTSLPDLKSMCFCIIVMLMCLRHTWSLQKWYFNFLWPSKHGSRHLICYVICIIRRDIAKNRFFHNGYLNLLKNGTWTYWQLVNIDFDSLCISSQYYICLQWSVSSHWVHLIIAMLWIYLSEIKNWYLDNRSCFIRYDVIWSIIIVSMTLQIIQVILTRR